MADHPWCRVTSLAADGALTRTWVLDGPDRPDAGAVDDLAHLALAAARRHERVVVRDLAPRMGELLRLAALPIEMEREPERGEQPLGFDEAEEKGHFGNLPA